MNVEVTVTQVAWDRYEVLLDPVGRLLFETAAQRLGIELPPAPASFDPPAAQVTVSRDVLTRIALGARNVLAAVPPAHDGDEVPPSTIRKFRDELKRRYLEQTPHTEWSAETGVLTAQPSPSGDADRVLVTVDVVAYDVLCATLGHYLRHTSITNPTPSSLGELFRSLSAFRGQAVDLHFHQSFADAQAAESGSGVSFLAPLAQFELSADELRDLAVAIKTVPAKTSATEMHAVTGYAPESVRAVGDRLASTSAICCGTVGNRGNE